jgi:magnesium transporter
MLSIFEAPELATQAPDSRPARPWVNLTCPTPAELEQVETQFDVPMEYLEAALDPDERARLESEDGILLVLMRVPLENLQKDGIPYITRPLAIIVSPTAIITVGNHAMPMLDDFSQQKTRRLDVANPRSFVLQVFQRTTLKYLRYLKEINTQSNVIERELQYNSRNRDVLQLLNLEKSLVYFSTSLRANHIIYERYERSRYFADATEEEQDTLDDTLIDSRQAIEMAKIYADILNVGMNAFHSVLSNNLNHVIKQLTVITIVLMLPTLLSSIYGMNVDLPFQNSPNAFAYIMGICAIVTLAGMWIFNYRKFF